MPDTQDLEAIVAQVAAEMRPHLGEGKVADYIPALARVNPRQFGIAVVTCEGGVVAAGDAGTPFSVQSVSKVFTLTLAVNRMDEALWARVGREPSGSPFNSIVQLELEKGIPRNPFINAGALVVTDAVLAGGHPAVAIADIAGFMRRLALDEAVGIDAEVAASERETGFRNASLANFLRALGNLNSPVDEVLEVYFNQCALSMNCRQLARAGLFLAHGGLDPMNRIQVTSPERARRINAIMMTCGHYDASGEFAYDVGLPGKSGVGGAILAIAPRRGSIAAWSPGLCEVGNSLVGAMALQRFAQLSGWSVF
jgi:glutaminase